MCIEEELEFIKEQRANDAGYHLILGQKWRRFGEPSKLPSPIVYSSIEFRLSIERIVFELYALMKKLKYISEEDAKKYESLTSVITQIMEIVGNSRNLYRILKFSAMLFDDDSQLIVKLAIPDVNKLKKYWYALSDYCHMKVNPENTWLSKEFVKKGYEILNEVETYLWDIKVRKHFGFYQMETWQPEVVALADDYVNSKIDDESVKTRLMLMKPVILSRYKK
ncbi:MAG TPA: hypothetical protein DCE80_00815 [Ignavibacteriales bacterium]|nr:hypothetical protein [Ignavibacteriales bacterium]